MARVGTLEALLADDPDAYMAALKNPEKSSVEPIMICRMKAIESADKALQQIAKGDAPPSKMDLIKYELGAAIVKLKVGKNLVKTPRWSDKLKGSVIPVEAVASGGVKAFYDRLKIDIEAGDLDEALAEAAGIELPAKKRRGGRKPKSA